jgi:hypothetical protein
MTGTKHSYTVKMYRVILIKCTEAFKINASIILHVIFKLNLHVLEL